MKYQDLSLYSQPDGLRGRSKFIVQLWWIVQSTLFRWSPRFCFSWRRFLLRLFGANVGKNTLIRSTAEFTYPWKVTIGDNCWVGDNCVFYSLADISIGNNVALAHGVYLCTGSHDYTSVSFDIMVNSIKINNEVWVANDVFVAPGVEISRGAVVGARSSVFSNVPEGVVCKGNPAVLSRSRLE